MSPPLPSPCSPQASSEYDDIRTNQSATATQLAFITREYTSHLSAPAVDNTASGLTAVTPSAGELETYVPTVPSGWARGTGSPKAAPVASTSTATAKKEEERKRVKPRHALPKGAVEGKAFSEDVS